MAKFNERLKQLRQEAGLSQMEFSTQLKLYVKDSKGCSKSSINMYERGEREPGIETLEAMADYFNVDMDYLLGKSDHKNKRAWLDSFALEKITTFASRLAELLSVREITQAELSRMTGIDKGRLSHYLRGDYEAKQDGVYDIAKATNVEEAWLMGYDVPMERKSRSSPRSNNILDIPNLIPIEPMERIPLLGAIACGDPILAQENIEDYIDLPRTIKADFALTCEGDSMIDAGIKDGDVVYIRSQPEVQNGQIAAVLVDGESATLKRFFFNDGVVTLMAANQSYPPIVKAGSDVEQVRVLGLAVGLSRSFFK